MKRLLCASLIIALSAGLAFLCTSSGPRPAREDILRFHIIANSDSPEDQALKYAVRDELVSAFNQAFRNVSGIEEAKAVALARLDEFEDLALHKIKREGFDYPVRAELGLYEFPTRAYGNRVYSAGSYEALRVVIGDGGGANWWCVMFPPLCFVDASSGGLAEPEPTRNEGEGEGAKATPEPAGHEETRVEYRFKLLEWLEGFINWLSKIFS